MFEPAVFETTNQRSGRRYSLPRKLRKPEPITNAEDAVNAKFENVPRIGRLLALLWPGSVQGPENHDLH
jgi:hypothetical protein